MNDAVRLGLSETRDISTPDTISFTITEELLNEMLQNITLSIITSYGLWNSTTNVSVETFVSIYEFSSPINLILPYSLSLLLSIPFILLGVHALHSNGFSANDGGFIQLITTARSPSLERKAGAGSLRGNIPAKLKELKIRFGELFYPQDKVQGFEGVKLGRKAGFGTEKETLPLKERPKAVDARAEWF